MAIMFKIFLIAFSLQYACTTTYIPPEIVFAVLLSHKKATYRPYFFFFFTMSPQTHPFFLVGMLSLCTTMLSFSWQLGGFKNALFARNPSKVNLNSTLKQTCLCVTFYYALKVNSILKLHALFCRKKINRHKFGMTIVLFGALSFEATPMKYQVAVSFLAVDL